jgi:lipid A 3-O-deacylase
LTQPFVSLAAAMIARNMRAGGLPAWQRSRGNVVSLFDLAKPVGLIAVVAVAAFAARPAAAQLSLGSPDEPPRLEGGGEYHFGDVIIPYFSPFLGLEATTSGATYAYFGFGFDINVTPNWVITPNGAAGVFQGGDGTRLGSWWEFRTGLEVDYKFADQTRLGVAVHHMSNAGLTKLNPGEQSIVLTYQVPLRW